MPDKIMLCNIAWMPYYDGESEMYGKQEFVRRNKDGGEKFNFSKYRGKYYGYVSYAGRGEQIKIEKFYDKEQEHVDDEYADDVFVIWVSRRPKGHLSVVGWYEGAKVYRYWREAPIHSKRGRADYWYIIEGDINKSTLIPEDRRTKEVSLQFRNYCFVRDDNQKEAVKEILDYIENFTKKRKTKKQTHKYSSDVFRRTQVERSAIELVANYYSEAGYEVKTREKDNLGWDLEANYNKIVLKLEVKGLSGDEPIVSLTPNEYEKMMQNLDEYRLCIVINALDKGKRKLSIYSYNHYTDKWTNIENSEEILDIQEKTYISAIAQPKIEKRTPFRISEIDEIEI